MIQENDLLWVAEFLSCFDVVELFSINNIEYDNVNDDKIF